MQDEFNEAQKRYIGAGIALGVSIGVAVGLALGNLALGVGPGIAIGVAVGVVLARKHGPKQDEGRTPEDSGEA